MKNSLGFLVYTSQSCNTQEISKIKSPLAIYRGCGCMCVQHSTHTLCCAARHDAHRSISVSESRCAVLSLALSLPPIDTCTARGWKVRLQLARALPRCGAAHIYTHITYPLVCVLPISGVYTYIYIYMALLRIFHLRVSSRDDGFFFSLRVSLSRCAVEVYASRGALD